MDIATIVLLLCVSFFTYRGYKAGLILSAGRILSLVGGYAASLLLAESLSPWLKQQLGMSDIAAMVLAAVGLFVIVSAGISSLVKMFFKRFPRTIRESALLSWSGAGLGAASGYLIAVLTLWFYSLMMGTISVAAPAMGERLNAAAGVNRATASVGQQLVDKTSSVLVQTVLQQTNQDDPMAQATALLMTQPQTTLQSLQRLSQDANLRSLLQSPNNQQVIATGKVTSIVQLPDFQRLRLTPDMQKLFPQEKLSDDQLAQLLFTYWQRAEALRNDEELQKALQDPQLQKSLKEGNTLAVLTHPGGSKLLSALLAPFPQESASSLSNASVLIPEQESRPATPKPSKVYQWVDEQGRTHFTDKEPK